jgi:hypothetical protein
MKAMVVSVLALSAMTSVALAAAPTGPQAGPIELTDAQMDGITAGGLDIAATPGRLGVSPHLAPANIGIFVNNNGQAATLIDRLSVALTAGGFTIVDVPGRLGVSARPGAANIGIFVNDNGQAGTLIDRLSVALTASGFTIVDTPGRLGVSTNLGAANIGIFGQAGMLADRPGFAPFVPHTGADRLFMSVR